MYTSLEAWFFFLSKGWKIDLNWLEPGVIDVCGKAPFYVNGGGQVPSFCSKATWDCAYLKGIKQILSTQKNISFASS